jgi:hypothetical protein
MPLPLSTPARAGHQGRCPAAMALVALALIWSGAVMSARADDRPFLRTTHAMASDDDAGWEVSSTLVSNRRGQALSLQIEHDLSPSQRLEFEFGKASRWDAPEPEQGLRLRSLWLSPQDHGVGVATKIGVEPGSAETGARRQALAVVSWPLWRERLWVHANAGFQWQRPLPAGPSRVTLSTLAAHYVLTPQLWLYAEGMRTSDARDRLMHMGVRQWLMHHKLALDVGGGRQEGMEHRGAFVAVNLSWMDLDF